MLIRQARASDTSSTTVLASASSADLGPSPLIRESGTVGELRPWPWCRLLQDPDDMAKERSVKLTEKTHKITVLTAAAFACISHCQETKTKIASLLGMLNLSDRAECRRTERLSMA